MTLHPSHDVVRQPYVQHPKCSRCGADAKDVGGFNRLINPCRFTGSGEFSIGGHYWPGLSKLIEEAGEVVQVAGKLIGSEGRTDHWSGDLDQMLHEELGDLLAAIEFFVHHNGLNKDLISDRSDRKRATFDQWHRENLARKTS